MTKKMAIYFIVIGGVILIIGMTLGLKTIRPMYLNVIAGLVILVGTFFGLFGKQLQDQSSSAKSDSISAKSDTILNKTTEFSSHLDSVSASIDLKIKNILGSIDSSQKVITSKTQEIDKSIQTFNDHISEALGNVDSGVVEVGRQTNRMLFPIPQIIKANLEISWSVDSREDVISRVQEKTLISNPYGIHNIYRIEPHSSAYSTIIYAFKNFHLTFKSIRGEVIYGLSIVPENARQDFYNVKEFNPTTDAILKYDEVEKRLKLVLEDCSFKLKYKAKDILSLLDIENSEIVLNINDRDDYRKVIHNINIETPSEYHDVIFGFSTYRGKENGEVSQYQYLKITIDPDFTNVKNFSVKTSNSREFFLGKFSIK